MVVGRLRYTWNPFDPCFDRKKQSNIFGVFCTYNTEVVLPRTFTLHHQVNHSFTVMVFEG